MKKKYRTIVVDGNEYAWFVRNNCDGDYNDFLTIWKRKNGKKKKLLFDDQYQYSDEELENNDLSITPAKVSEMIKVLIHMEVYNNTILNK